MNLINHDVVSHDVLYHWAVLPVYLWQGSRAIYSCPKPNPKSVSEQEVEEELQKSKLNNRTEFNIEKKKKKIVLYTGISNPNITFF